MAAAMFIGAIPSRGKYYVGAVPPGPMTLPPGIRTFPYRWEYKPPLGTELDPDHSLTPRLLHYPISEGAGSTLTNLALGARGNAPVFNSSWTTGTSGPGLLIGNAGQIACPDQPPQTDFTFAIRYRWASNAYGAIFSFDNVYNSTATYREYMTSYADNGSGSATLSCSIGGVGDGISWAHPPAGQDVTLVVTRQGGVVRAYLDGVRVGTNLAVGSGATLPIQGLTIGSDVFNENLYGMVYWFSMYDRALDPVEIETITWDPYRFYPAPASRTLPAPSAGILAVEPAPYRWEYKPPLGTELDLDSTLAQGLVWAPPLAERAGNRCYDSGPAGLTGTLTAATQWSVWAGGPCLIFATPQNMATANVPARLFPSGDWSTSLWFLASGLGLSGTFHSLIALGNSTTSAGFFYLYLDSAGKIYSVIPWGENVIAPGPAVTINTWYHLAVTRLRNAWTMYLNGRKVATGTSTTPGTATGTFNLGNFVSNYLDGRIDRPRVWNRALEPAEILEDYSDPHQIFRTPDSYNLSLVPQTIIPPAPTTTSSLNQGGDSFLIGARVLAHASATLVRATFARVQAADALARATTASIHMVDAAARSTLGRVFTTTTTPQGTLTRTFVTDTLLRRSASVVQAADALARATAARTHVADATARSTLARVFTTTTIPRATFTRTFVTDTLLRRSASVVQAADALTRAIAARPHATDAAARGTLGRVFTTTTTPQGTLTRTFVTDTLLRQVASVAQTSDILTRAVRALTHGTNTRTLGIFTRGHTTTVLARATSTRAFATDTRLRAGLARAQGTDVLTLQVRATTYGTDTRTLGARLLAAAGDTRLRDSPVLAQGVAALTQAAGGVVQYADMLAWGARAGIATGDALARGTFTCVLTSDVRSRGTGAAALGTDLATRAGRGMVQLTDVRVRGSRVLVQAGDALAYRPAGTVQEADVLVRLVRATTQGSDTRTLGGVGRGHTTTVLVRSTRTRGHLGSSLSRRTSMLVQATSSLARRMVARIHGDDSLLRGSPIRSGRADAYLSPGDPPGTHRQGTSICLAHPFNIEAEDLIIGADSVAGHIRWPGDIAWYRFIVAEPGSYAVTVSGIEGPQDPAELVLWLHREEQLPAGHFDERSGPIGNPYIAADLTPGRYVTRVAHREGSAMARFRIRVWQTA